MQMAGDAIILVLVSKVTAIGNIFSRIVVVKFVLAMTRLADLV